MTDKAENTTDYLKEFESTLAQLAEFKDFFTDKDKINDLVDCIHDETNINKATLRLIIKHIAPLIIASVATVGGVVGESWRRKLKERLNQYAWYFNASQWLLNALKTHTDKSFELAIAIPSNEHLEAIIKNEPRWEGLKPEHQGLIQLLLGQNAQTEGQDLLQQQLTHVLSLLHFDLDLKTPEYLIQSSQKAEVGSSVWLTYSSRQAHLVGRESSIRLLDNFIDQDNLFSWWLVSGVGGVGKSRLALEALLRHDHLWEVGFLNAIKLQKPDALSQWKPICPTFIVIDYAAEYAPQIATWIDHLIQHQDDYYFPIRLLILERETKQQTWWDNLISGSSDALRRQQSLFIGEPHELAPLGNSVHQRAILSNFLNSLDCDTPLPESEDNFWQKLNEITDKGRPLFLGMAAIAIQQHGVHQLRQWNQDELLANMLQREQSIWDKQLAQHANPAQVINLLALSSVSAGFDWDNNEDQILDSLIDCGLAKDDTEALENKALLITLTGHQGGYLQPDLLAEYFVLQHWAKVTRPIKRYLSTAYALNPENTLAFISRCAIDYPENKSSWQWWDALRQNLNDQEVLNDLYDAAFRIIGQLNIHGKYQINLQQWLPPLCELDDQKRLANAINWMGLQHLHLGQLNKVFEYHNQSLFITREIGDKQGEGSALNNISRVFKIQGDYETALEYLKQSLEIQQKFSDKFGEGTVLNNMSTIYSSLGDYEAALEYLKQSLVITQGIGDKLGEESRSTTSHKSIMPKATMGRHWST